jgi:hypothetical protein
MNFKNAVKTIFREIGQCLKGIKGKGKDEAVSSLAHNRDAYEM